MEKTKGCLVIILLLSWAALLTNCGEPPSPPPLRFPGISISSPADGSILNSTIVVVSGTAISPPPVSEILSVVVNEVVAEGTNNWTVTVELNEGVNTITAKAIDTSGLIATASINVCVDSPEPEVSITSPAEGSTFNTSAIIVMGTASDVTPNCGPIAMVTVDGIIASGTTEWVVTLTTLTQGINTIEATAIDAAGNSGSDSVSVCVDSVAPVVTITEPTDGSTMNSTIVTVDANISEANTCGATVVAVLVNGFTQATILPVGIPLGEGSNTIEVIATDAAGNSGSDSVSVCVDTIAPSISITSPVDAATLNDTTVMVTGTVDGTGSCSPEVTVEVNGTPAATVGGNWVGTVTLVGQGPQTITAVATDAVGNRGSDSVVVCVDLVAPVVTITQPTDGSILNSTVVTVDTNISEANTCGATVVAVLVNGFTQATSLPADVPLSEGSNTIEVVATDAAGNRGSDSVSFCVDTIAPSISITNPVDGATLTNPVVMVTGSVDGTGVCGSVSVVVDPGAVDAVVNQVTGNWGANVVLTEGPNSITAVVISPAGNTNSVSINVTLDTMPPTVRITDPVDGATFSTFYINVTITTDAEVGNTASIRVNGITLKSISVSGVTNTFTGVQIVKGSNTLVAAVYDSAGNLGASPPVNVTVSTAAPGIKITSPAAGELFGSDDDSNILVSGFQLASVTVSTDAVDGSTVLLFVNGQTATMDGGNPLPVVTVVGGTAEFVNIDLVEGANNIVARVTDKVTLESGVTLPVPVTVDTVPPAPPLLPLAPAANATLNASDDLNGGTPILETNVIGLAGIGDKITVYDTDGVTVLGSEVVGPSGGYSITISLSEGAHTLYLTATDPAGNEGGATMVENIMVDTAAPTVFITSPVDGSTFNTSTVTVMGTASDVMPNRGPIALVTVNGVIASGTTEWGVTLTTLIQGANTIIATAIDAAGNSGSGYVVICVDSVTPVVTITEPTDGSTLNSTTVTVDANISEANSCGATAVAVLVNGFTQATSLPVGIPLGEGGNTIEVVATDAAGNRGSDSVGVCVDTIAPSISITGPVDGATFDNPVVMVTGSVDDTGVCGPVSVVVDPGAVDAVVDQVSGSWYANVNLAEGPNSITAVATDAAGNSESDSVVVCVDSLNPTISINSPSDGALLNINPLNVTGSVNDTGVCGPVSVVVDPGAVDAVVNQVTGSWSANVNLAEGPNSITAVVTDALGNTDIVSIDVTIDTIAPTVGINDPINGTTFYTFYISVTITTDAELGNTASIRVNGVAVKSIVVSGVTNTFTGVQIVKGSNTLVAEVYDSAGNLGTSPPVNVTVSTEAPGVEITYPPAGTQFGLGDDSNILVSGFQLDSVTVSTDAVDGSTVLLFVNGQTATMNDGNPHPVVTVLGGQAEFNDIDLAEGTNNIVARVTDKVTLLSGATLPIPVRVKTIVLTVIISSPREGSTISSQILVRGLAYPADDVSSVIVNGETAYYNKLWIHWKVPLTAAGCGPSLIQAIAWDKDGKYTTTSVNVFVDTTIPVINIVTPTDGSTINANSVVVSGTAIDDCTKIDRVMVNGVTADYDLGNWTATISLACLSYNSITAMAIDEANNRSSATVTNIFSGSCLIPDSISISAGSVVVGCSEATVTLASGLTGVSGQGHNIRISTDRFYGPTTLFAVTFEQPSSTVAPLVIEGFTVTDPTVEVIDYASAPGHLTQYGSQCLRFWGTQADSIDGEITSEVIDTTGFVNLNLKFKLGTENTEGQDVFYVDVTNDGGLIWYNMYNWVSPGEITAATNNDIDYIDHIVYFPSAYFADGAQIQIRLRWTGSADGDRAFLENVVLIGEPGRTVGRPINYLWDFEPPETVMQPTNIIQDYSITATPVNVTGTAGAQVPPGVKDTQAVELGPTGTAFDGGEITSDLLDLTETSEMYLTFDVGYSGVDSPSYANAGDSIVVSASTSGSSWNEISTFFVTAPIETQVDLDYETKIFYLPQVYAIDTAQIRFSWRPDQVSNVPGPEGLELAYLDNTMIWNVKVEIDTGKPKDRGYFISDNQDGTYTFDVCSGEPGPATIYATWDDSVNPPLTDFTIINF